uniref:non-specific serine/threonine protein kinase n=1 Tax=Podospora anserina (strain S / ATCC MYA-4624 / DSM 980 / FGSC 10383) TaxID=515849 RepID=A0A090CCF8_PODAN|nr:Putative cell division control protein [Podospora anserina S mat+]
MAPPPPPPPPIGPSGSDRAAAAYHQGGGNGGKLQQQQQQQAVVGSSKTPGTPRREQSYRLEKPVQDPGLKDYRLGDCIGKGAFGSVYKAFNWGTGEAVAVKQIKLVDVPKSELRMVEIDLLKNLNHPNIVKYVGFVKTAECLNIILEYCENGSLHSICKAYGKFPENLVGVYMAQVLQGLQYLHDQGLADFGVSTSQFMTGNDKEAQVVGTPYWMAPEIIQLSGATSASDIWSVGCTVIELLQGKPPYHNLAAMPALFAIVNDDHPPLPEGVSPVARDFLMACFQKDPNLRVTAKKLMKHPWIIGCRRTDAPVSRPPANFNQAVEEVKQWNKALRSSEHNMRVSIGSDQSNGPISQRPNLATNIRGPLTLVTKQRPTPDAFRSPEVPDDDNWDNDFASAISPTALHLPHIKGQDNFGGLLSSDRLKAFASIDSHQDSENWDDNFEGELLTIKGPKHWSESFDAQEQTIRPLPKKSSDRLSEKHRRQRSRDSRVSKSPTKQQLLGNNGKFELPPRPDLLYREQSGDNDYSDLFADNEGVFDRRLGVVKEAPQLFHPSDLTSPPPRSATQHQQSPLGASIRRPNSSRPPATTGSSLQPPEPPVRRTRSQVEITKFAEDEQDEDFSDIFGVVPGTDNATSFLKNEATAEESDRGSEDGQQQQQQLVLSKLSNSSWLGDDDGDEDDPFAMMEEPGWMDEMDLAANIARDRHARMAEKVESLVKSLSKMRQVEDEEVLGELAEDLLAYLWEGGEEVKGLIMGAHGLLPILEILEGCGVKSRGGMVLGLLRIVNAIILDDVELQENLCFVGGIPIVTKFAARQYSNEIRLEAAAFVRQMYQTSTLTLQMFVSAGGLNVLVEFLDEDYETSQDLVLIGVNGIWNVFELQGPTPKNDFCRIFSRSKILDPLAAILHKVLDEERGDELSELVEGRIVGIFYLFSQAEAYVKEVVAERQVLKTVLKDLRRMTPAHQITMLKFIKNMSQCSAVLDALHSADAIDFLIDVLSLSMKKGQKHFREISNQVLNTMFNLCRLSKERQEYAASNGIIPLLLKIMKTDRPPKEFVLPILCDMAHSGSKGRRYLWQNHGLEFYVTLLADQYWQVTALDAIHVWLQEETAKVESHLMDGMFMTAIVSCFNPAKANAFDPNLLEPLLKVLRLSPAVAASLAKAEMYAGIAQKLGHKKAVVRLNLLRLVRNIMDGCEAHNLSMSSNSSSNTGKQLRALFDDIQGLADKDPAVLVRNLAGELVRAHFGNDLQHEALALSGLGLGNSVQGSMGGSVGGAGVGAGRSRSGPRRNTSYTPPGGLHLSGGGGGPHTPTGHRASQSSSSAAAYIEVANSTPKRTVVGLAQDREAALFRPRSREGAVVATSIPRRVSQDATAAGLAMSPSSGSGVKSRLPRTSHSHFTRPSLSTAASMPITATRAERSDSSLSSREHVMGRLRSGSSISITGASQYSASPTSSSFLSAAGFNLVNPSSSNRPSSSSAAFGHQARRDSHSQSRSYFSQSARQDSSSSERFSQSARQDGADRLGERLERIERERDASGGSGSTSLSTGSSGTTATTATSGQSGNKVRRARAPSSISRMESVSDVNLPAGGRDGGDNKGRWP